jgi:hypothetical protein
LIAEAGVFHHVFGSNTTLLVQLGPENNAAD